MVALVNLNADLKGYRTRYKTRNRNTVRAAFSFSLLLLQIISADEVVVSGTVSLQVWCLYESKVAVGEGSGGTMDQLLN